MVSNRMLSALLILCLLTSVSADSFDYLEVDDDQTIVEGPVRILQHRSYVPINVMEEERNIVRLEVQEVITEMTCPANMRLVGKQCQGKELCPPKYVCTAGSRLVDGECLTFTQPISECPSGYAMKGGKCSTCDSFPADFTCPREGENLDASGRSCTKEIPQPDTCPCGFAMVDGECMQRLPSRMECPEGFTLNKATKECSKNNVCPPTMVCPEGSSLQGSKCVAVRQDPPRCPKGFTFDADRQTCTKVVPQVPGDCPYGFERVGAGCEKVDKSPADEFCPPEYVMDFNGSCIKEVPIPPKCPPGFQHSRDIEGACEKIVKEIPQCPHGTVSVGGKCERTVEHDMTQCCPAGYEMEAATCVKIEEHAPQLSCEGGCHKVKASRVSYACPEGTEFVDHPTSPKCTRKVLASACPEPEKFEMSARCLSLKKKSSSELRSLSFDFAAECSAPTPPPCREVTKEEILLAQAYCSEGQLEGNVCITRERIIPEKTCSVGVLDPVTEQCIKKVTAAVESKCPPGTKRDGFHCIAKETVQPDHICPEDSETGPNGCCIVRTPILYSAPNVLRSPSSLRCDVGRLSAAEKMCVEVSKAPRDMVCPANTEMADCGCVAVAELIIPAPIEKVVRPSYVCGEGQTLKANNCHSVEKLPSAVVCPNGSFLGENDQCIKMGETIVNPPRVVTSVAVPVCPPGSQARGTTCMVTLEAEVIKSCAPGFEFRGNQCAKVVDQRAVCPAGMKETDEGCVRDLFAAPSVRVVKGCVNDVTPVCDGCPREVATTCTSQ